MASVREQIAVETALRSVVGTSKAETYPCKFRWEIPDNRLLERFVMKKERGQLTDRQELWYLTRIGFRDLTVRKE